ncbi:MarR family winged helix-turn-helix transcriptional regulator [Pseudonocardia sp. N23]|uniref:MarR family winged helix-turn-helix transcriptional regulator n=1 Tax=Pseudonocardia sp. N23 TaxID=1987376 RepID=UPI000C02F0B5|nr:MarR family transcriptional regulator [Pseudonocardia sp. N23]GAY11591.1 transcriptional regulator, MarR family [Pseudonocardia sp. N23]
MTPPRGDELMAAVMGLRRVVRRRVRETSTDPVLLRGAQLELLQLVESDPGVGVAAAARGLHLAANTVSTLVNQLVGAGLLERTPDPGDRRAARLQLTAAARARLARWRAARGALVTAGIGELTSEEQAALAAALPALARLTDLLADQPHPAVPAAPAVPAVPDEEEAG